MGVLETVARVIELGGEKAHAGLVATLRADFEARTGAFAPEDPWFEERSRAFWVDAIARRRFGHAVLPRLSAEEAAFLPLIERAHRGLFRAEARTGTRGRRPVLVDVWSGAELVPTLVDEASRAELDAAVGQLFDARVVGSMAPFGITLLPGAVFHPRHATPAIAPVLAAARTSSLSTDETLDALLRMERTLRALSRVKAAYAYRPEALAPPAPRTAAVRAHLKRPT
jgi:hypothetical protein